MNRKAVICLVTAALLSAVPFVEAQQAKKVPRIGALAGGSPTTFAARYEALRQGLRELGYVEGQNIAVEYRYAEGKMERLPDFAADLVRLKVDIIIAAGDLSIRAAKQATRTIPIVVALAGDLVGSGHVASLARPGGNITGLTTLANELAGKRIELLKETVPKVSRLAVLVWNPDGPGNAAERSEIESAARALGVQVQPVEIRGANDLESGFSAMTRGGANALMGLTDTRFAGNRQRVVELSAKNRLPAIYPERLFVETGGLMSYGTNRAEWRRRLAYYVDKILRGTKPADLPVEQPMKFELVINLKTAKQIGLTIPQSVLYRADKVIK